MPPISNTNIYNLLDLIYETTLNNSSKSWNDVYKRISTMFSSGPGGLSLFSDIENRFDLVASTLDSERLKQYNEYYYKISPFRRKIEKMEAGEYFSRSEHCPDEAFVKTEIYQEYFKKIDVFYYDYEVLFKNSNVSGGISFSRPKTMKDFTLQEKEAKRLIIPHIRRAFQIYYKLNQVKRNQRILTETLNTIPQSVIAVDKSGKTVYANDNAHRIISEKDGLQLDQAGNLITGLSQETKRLRIILESAFNFNISKKVNYGGTMKISRPSGLRPFSILVSPIINQPFPVFGSDSAALIFITDPEEKVKTFEPVLRDIYGLTPAESRLASILAEGQSLKDACKLLNVKDSTVRTHLKQIFSKTDTHRQSDLVRLILTGPANLQKKSLNVK